MNDNFAKTGGVLVALDSAQVNSTASWHIATIGGGAFAFSAFSNFESLSVSIPACFSTKVELLVAGGIWGERSSTNEAIIGVWSMHVIIPRWRCLIPLLLLAAAVSTSGYARGSITVAAQAAAAAWHGVAPASVENQCGKDVVNHHVGALRLWPIPCTYQHDRGMSCIVLVVDSNSNSNIIKVVLLCGGAGADAGLDSQTTCSNRGGSVVDSWFAET